MRVELKTYSSAVCHAAQVKRGFECERESCALSWARLDGSQLAASIVSPSRGQALATGPLLHLGGHHVSTRRRRADAGGASQSTLPIPSSLKDLSATLSSSQPHMAPLPLSQTRADRCSPRPKETHARGKVWETARSILVSSWCDAPTGSTGLDNRRLETQREVYASVRGPPRPTPLWTEYRGSACAPGQGRE